MFDLDEESPMSSKLHPADLLPRLETKLFHQKYVPMKSSSGSTPISLLRSYSDGDAQSCQASDVIKESLTLCKERCDSEVDELIDELKSIIQQAHFENFQNLSISLDLNFQTSPDPVLDEKMDLLIKLIDIGQKICKMEIYELLNSDIVQNVIVEIQSLQSILEKSGDPSLARYAVKLLISFSRISRVSEYLEIDSESHFLETSNSSPVRESNLYSFSPTYSQDPYSGSSGSFLFDSPTLGPTLGVSERSDSEFYISTKEESNFASSLQSLVDESISLHVIICIQRDRTVSFISSSCLQVFGKTILYL
jgi:hypothetical protein